MKKLEIIGTQDALTMDDLGIIVVSIERVEEDPTPQQVDAARDLVREVRALVDPEKETP